MTLPAVADNGAAQPTTTGQNRQMLDFQIPRITSDKSDDDHGSFVIEPLDRGFGYTFGNSLRRSARSRALQ